MIQLLNNSKVLMMLWTFLTYSDHHRTKINNLQMMMITKIITIIKHINKNIKIINKNIIKIRKKKILFMNKTKIIINPVMLHHHNTHSNRKTFHNQIFKTTSNIINIIKKKICKNLNLTLIQVNYMSFTTKNKMKKKFWNMN